VGVAIYALTLTIPGGTTASNPATAKMQVPFGKLIKCIFIPDSSSNGNVGVQLWRGLKPILPRNQNTWIITDFPLVIDGVDEKIDRESNLIILKGYNSNTYDVTVQMLLDVMEEGEK